MEESMFFYVWWVLVNGVQDYLALEFLIGMTGRRTDRKQTGIWICSSLFMTLAAVRFQFPGMFLLHMLFLILFSRWVLRMDWLEMALPETVLFSLATFTEGFSTVVLSFLSAVVEMEGRGIFLQVLISILSVWMYALWLKRICRKYAETLRPSSLSGSYLLLLPCVSLVLAVRVCLRLDSRVFEQYLSSLELDTGLMIGMVMGTAILAFFLMLEIFYRMLFIIEEKQAVELLAEQMKGQRRYLDEIRKKSERYASFQHDINNHLLVFSGLMQEGKYEEAEHYAAGMYGKSLSLGEYVSSGNVIVDILLREKLQEAREKGVEVFCDVRIPGVFSIEDIDLCVLFSNILDNAMHACRKGECEAPILSIKAKARGKFLLVEERNTVSLSRPIKEGTGLGNIRKIARRYHGTVELATGEGEFQISVLLCPAQCPTKERKIPKLS